jgi:hypothetical protein
MKHNKRTKSESVYINAIIQNLSLQRLTDQEIVDHLHNEKQIEIARSTVTNTRNRMEKESAKWYTELKQSTSKYIAAYKQRIDSLFSYQKKLHEIIAATKRDEVKIRAISELHAIEIDVFNLWKQLPNLDIDIVNSSKQEQPSIIEESGIFTEEDLNGLENEPLSHPDPAAGYCWHGYIRCDGCKRWFNGEALLKYHKKRNNNTSICSIPNIDYPSSVASVVDDDVVSDFGKNEVGNSKSSTN